ncbi:head-tail adaptor protein [Sinorhizobium meliloti]|uniref:phage head closure protein n=1 Tax=Rhizobium meliloti TaxID=382 RepID=UPI000FDB36B0|nr:phage head closure protein [Sinorhizobium meliloti]RVK61937.1 head-tail adaptor protein [Sinorhizobium meliloti]
MAITAQELDRRITIERATTVVDEFNEPIETWAPFITVWAQRKDSSDLVRKEILGAEQVGSFLLSHFVIRYSSQAKTITPVDRIDYDGHIWNIKSTKETADGRFRFIEITAVRANN